MPLTYLVAAKLVIPAVTARLLTNRFSRMLWLSATIGAVCGFVGMNASYHLDIPAGTTIVLTGAITFAATLTVTGGRRLRRTGRYRAQPLGTPGPAPAAKAPSPR